MNEITRERIRSAYLLLLTMVNYEVAVGTAENNPSVVAVVPDSHPRHRADWPVKWFVDGLDRLACAQVPHDETRIVV